MIETAADAKLVLEARGLRKSYGNLLAVDGVGFHISEGETYGLLGPNGAGKTTTISMVCGLLSRDDGEVLVAGMPMDTRTVDAKKAIGFVPQEIAMYPDLTARENLNFFGKLYGLARDELASRVDESLTITDLKDRADDRTGEYSGGMKRRLNIALGLLNRPRLLVLDEPTVGVDPQSRNAILSSVEELGRGGMAVLYTTHYMEEAERLCDRVGIIDGGQIKAEGTRRELVSLVGERDRVHLTATGQIEAAAASCGQIPGVDEATVVVDGIDLIVQEAGRMLPRILQQATDAGAEISRVDVVEPDLEAVFLHLTGKALRD